MPQVPFKWGNCTKIRGDLTIADDDKEQEFNFVDALKTDSSTGQVTVETDSYFVSEGPGSLLKVRGSPIDRSRQAKTSFFMHLSILRFCAILIP